MDRKIGVEIEFSGLSIDDTANIIQKVFSGKNNKKHTSLIELNETDIGEIKIEVDAHLAKTISENTKKYQDHSILSDVMDSVDQIGNRVMMLSAVPVEVVFPPISQNDLKMIDNLIPIFEKAGAQGTQEKLIYAFGVHLNVEIEQETLVYFSDMLLSFFLLQAWLAKKSRLDISRTISGYNKLYPHSFGIGLIKNNFQKRLDLIEFYKEEVPDRNYALDMYPVWAYLDKDLLKNMEDAHLTSPRPTFHYRLPDCKLGQEGWSFTRELDLWQEVETLAKDKAKLKKISASYLDEIKQYSDPLDIKWLDILSNEWEYHV